MKYLITGATGLVGKEIVRLCHDSGIAVNYLTTSKSKIVSKKDYKGFYWNPDTGEIDSACFEGVSAIINLAGASISKKWTPSNKKQILNSRINSIGTLFNALNKGEFEEIDTFVSASAIGVYPNSLEKYYDEDTAEIDDSFLGEVVQQWEAEVDRLNTFNMSVAKVRIGLVLASEGGALPQMAKPVKMFVGAAFGSGEQWQSWIHITDLARIFMFAAKNKLSGVYNGVAPNPISQKKLIKEIAIVLKRPLLLPNIPKFFIKTILGEMSYLLLASQRVSAKKIKEEGFDFVHSNIALALQAIYSKANSKD
ncbi:TIGR01777 family oxidoreductase [Aurantibacter crassamenti]|uniref:TIGR01777 family oxidoreductase n=1 Tax=Aurantibacter crassamenti TaxID=1837375 RepID=UPI00193ADD28|nr:TIGR01777 family oxidoreductase [Aurantibacter crassamenti]MBM1106355.1 TIGR01777 family oxidoreductase [Aurantibacter crassamenti]